MTVYFSGVIIHRGEKQNQNIKSVSFSGIVIYVGMYNFGWLLWQSWKLRILLSIGCSVNQNKSILSLQSNVTRVRDNQGQGLLNYLFLKISCISQVESEYLHYCHGNIDDNGYEFVNRVKLCVLKCNNEVNQWVDT